MARRGRPPHKAHIQRRMWDWIQQKRSEGKTITKKQIIDEALEEDAKFFNGDQKKLQSWVYRILRRNGLSIRDLQQRSALTRKQDLKEPVQLARPSKKQSIKSLKRKRDMMAVLFQRPSKKRCMKLSISKRKRDIMATFVQRKLRRIYEYSL